MRITPLPEVEPRPRRVAVGVFDGVHLGHREVVRGADTVLTFDPHPLAVIQPAAAPKLLTPTPVKAELLGELGVDEVAVIPFDEEFSRRSAESFVDDVIVGALGATHVSVGRNFRFGHRARGDADMLAADPRFETRVVELVEVEGETVSSSHIRGLVLAGEVAHAIAFLGRRFQIRGTVVRGDGRGRDLGYPTANLVPDEQLVRPAQYEDQLGARTSGDAERAQSATGADTPVIAKDRELQDSADPLLAADEPKILVGWTKDRQGDAGTDAKSRARASSNSKIRRRRSRLRRS